MAKRAARRAKLHAIEGDRIHSVVFEHTPANDRDQSYLRKVRPRSDNQRLLIEAIDGKPLTIALGPAGTGKTYLAIAKAVEALEAGKVGAHRALPRPRSRPANPSAILPGDMEDKLAPYLRPLYDALIRPAVHEAGAPLMAEGAIEIAPVGFMRGRTLNNAFVVIDEAQNCTYVQLKMLLTRLGWHSTMVVTGDPDQSDLLPGTLRPGPIAQRLEGFEDVAVVQLADKDVVRHPLVGRMLSVL